MEYSLAQSLDNYSEISQSCFPRLNSDPANDKVNPGLGQIINLYEVIVPIHGRSLHTIEKKVESDEIKSTVEIPVKPEQSGSGAAVEPEILKSFLHPIVTDSIDFSKLSKPIPPKKHKSGTKPDFNAKKLKLEHKFKVV